MRHVTTWNDLYSNNNRAISAPYDVGRRHLRQVESTKRPGVMNLNGPYLAPDVKLNAFSTVRLKALYRSGVWYTKQHA